MAEKDPKRLEQTEKPAEAEVTELDDRNLEEASGGLETPQEDSSVTNNCNC